MRIILFSLISLLAVASAQTCAAGFYDQCGVCGGDGSKCVCPVPSITPSFAVINTNCNPSCYTPQALNRVQNQPTQKILICHGTASQTNPYVLLSVAAQAVNGHFDGTAPGHGPRNHPDIYLGHVGAFNYSYDCNCNPVDLCPQDPAKMYPGICGCGVPDTIDPATGQVVCRCTFVPKDKCEVGCKCFSFRIISALNDGTATFITFNVTNYCSTPTTYVVIGANNVQRMQPAAGSVYQGNLGSYTVDYTDTTTDPPYANGIKFTPSTASLMNGATESFSLSVSGYNPQTTQFELIGHTADIWEPFAFSQDPTCACNCNQTCPLGYSVSSGCKSCGSSTPGLMNWCTPTGSYDNPYALTQVPVGSNPSSGFAPGSTDNQAFSLSCTCVRNMIDCPNNCYGNGDCNHATGVCTCAQGFTGVDCAPTPSTYTQVNCSDLNYCSGNGRCVSGACVCYGNYSGLACTDLPYGGCSDSPDCGTCSGRAGCVWCGNAGGIPSCTETTTCQGGTKPSCFVTEIPYIAPPCPDQCSGHGSCQNNKCQCNDGWQGINCGATALTTAAKIGIGVSAGVVAGIVIGVIAFFALTAGAGYAGYRYRKINNQGLNTSGQNPLYDEGGRTGQNPLYRLSAYFTRK